MLISKGDPFCFQALGLPLCNKCANAMNCEQFHDAKGKAGMQVNEKCIKHAPDETTTLEMRQD